MTYADQILGINSGNLGLSHKSALAASAAIAAEADAEIASLKAEIARMREYEVSNRLALEAWLSGEPSRPPITGRRKTVIGAGEGGE